MESLRKADLERLVLENISDSNKVNIYFKLHERTPICGKFVKLADHDDLWKKGMVRFSEQQKYVEFKKNPISMYTRIFIVEKFSYIKINNYELQA